MSNVSTSRGGQRPETASRWSQLPNPSEVAEGTKSMISEHAVSSVALCFGLGFGAGVLIGVSLCQAYAASHRERSMAERYGQHFMDAVSKMVPSSITGRT